MATRLTALMTCGILTGIGICGCSGSDGLAPPVRHDVSAAELRAMMADGSPLVDLDVRTTAEYDAGHIPGSLNIPLGDLAGRCAELNATTRTACVCSAGARSTQAAQILLDNGFVSVYNLQGGLLGWSDPLEPRHLAARPAA